MLQLRSIAWLGIPLVALLACSANDDPGGGGGSTSTGGTTPTTGGTSSGGATSGGATSGGASLGGTSNGGTSAGGTAPSTGGSVSTGGVPSTGGATIGGQTSTGGTGGTVGGSTNGGSKATGGASTGGTTGGSSTTNGGSGGNAGGAGKSGGGKGGSAATGGSSSTGGSATTGGNTGTGGGSTGGTPAEKTIRVFWLRPSDVPFDQKYPDGIGKVMLEAQKYYMAELGKTFKLNTPIVETVVGDHVKNWYETTPNGGDKYWWSVTNMENELVKKFGLKNPDSRWMVVGEISAEGDGAGGGGSPGWVILCQHDADGAVGIGGTMNRWYGGMVHELGHAFGLPDSSGDDGTPMSGDFYSYPDTHFSQAQKNSILNGGQKSFLF